MSIFVGLDGKINNCVPIENAHRFQGISYRHLYFRRNSIKYRIGNIRFFVASRYGTVILGGKKFVYMYVKVYPIYAVQKVVGEREKFAFSLLR